MLLSCCLFFAAITDSTSTYSKNKVQEQILPISVMMNNHPKLGRILTDSQGMTLYMYTKDTNNKSACYDECTNQWLPFLTSETQPHLQEGIPGRLETLTRNDYSRQITYDGIPLYYYVEDKMPGDAFGQNKEYKWKVVRPGSYK